MRTDFIGRAAELALLNGSVPRSIINDLSAMAAGVAEVPGFTVGRSGLVIVTRSGLVAGLDLGHVDLVWGPDDVVRAWRAESPSG